MPVGDIMVFDIKDTCSCHLIATRLDTTLVLDNVLTNEQKYYVHFNFESASSKNPFTYCKFL